MATKTKKPGARKQAKLKARTIASRKAARSHPVPAGGKLAKGHDYKLVDYKISEAFKELNDKILTRASELQAQSNVVEVDDVIIEEEINMTLDEFDSIKEESRKKRKGFAKVAQSYGWELKGTGDKDCNEDWRKFVPVEG